MHLERILVAVDTANVREAAFDRALWLARASGAELHVLHGVPVDESFSERADQRLRRMLELRTRAEQAGVRVQAVEQHGHPAEIIALHADARAVDLVVIGSEPRAGWSPLRPSPIAERVLRSTNRPTLVVAGEEAAVEPGFRHVLIAVDLFAGIERLVRSALAVAAGAPPRLTVLHAVTGLEAADAVQSPARWMVPEYRTHVLDETRRNLEAAVSAAGAAVDAEVRVTTGPAVEGILEHAAASESDLIVVGRSRGFRPLGSTPLRVLRKNDRALLVVPAADASRQSDGERRRAA